MADIKTVRIGGTSYNIVDATAAHGSFLPLSGGTLTGNILGGQTVALGTTASPFHNIVLGGATNATMTKDSTNPRITFCESTGSQPVHLLYTDYDNYRSPAGLKIVGGDNATPAWLEVEGTIYGATFSGSGASLTSLNASNISSGTLNAARLPTSGVTAGSYGPTANVTGSNNTTISVPQITVDTYGRVTSVTNRTYTSVNTDNDTKNTAGSTDTTSKIFLIGATSQAANPQTYSDNEVYVTSGTLTTSNTVATIFGVSASNGTSGGISLYSGTGNVDQYGIAFRTTANKEKHGYVQSDWATYFTMNDADTRGWIFRKNKTGGNVASISGAGNAVFNGNITVGGNQTNTSGCRMQYNSTTLALDFIFA